MTYTDKDYTFYVILCTLFGHKEGLDVEELTVFCWKKDERAFGMHKYPEYPSLIKMRHRLYGKKNLMGLGFVETDRYGDYTITSKGINYMNNMKDIWKCKR